MLTDKDISIHLSCQQFECNSFEISSVNSVLKFESTRDSSDEVCPHCGGKVHVYDNGRMVLRDMPLWHGVPLKLDVGHHRYRCTVCGRSFSEDVCMRYPGTRITHRAAKWVQELLRWHLPISSVHEITGFHWDTIRRIHESVMNGTLDWRRKELQDKDYRPQYLAVDEFAIHKGHRYATCVMDLAEGDILWVGRGRSKADFARFFGEIDPDYLSEVKAVAMDMNASYNILVERHLPHAEIVYDRYHMQAQFGKEVLGVVRLEEARAGGIAALVRFAELKEKRIEGLVAHARHNISTGRLEGFNNKIKVAKRIGYGYRNEEYFFTLVRYMSIPAVRFQSPRKT